MQKRLLLIPFTCTLFLQFVSTAYANGPYQPTWESLSEAPLPEWAIDAKFGIYAHWGIYSVGIGPAWTERHLYVYQNPKILEKFEELVGGGLADSKGYKDLLPFFTAGKYDPAYWADLVKQSGAKFAGFSIGHHDNFGLWDSDVGTWNAGKMGPKRDLYGEFVEELRNRDLRVFCTSHIYRHYSWSVPKDNDPDDLKVLEKGMRENWDVFDPEYRDIYANKYNGTDYEQYRKTWQKKITEVIDKYYPDIMWFDGDINQGVDFLEPLAHYFNMAQKRGQEVVICNKYPMSDPGLDAEWFNFPSSFGWLNFEQGRDRPMHVDRHWSEDFTITGKAWSYTGYEGSQTGKQLLRRLIDCTARGGAILLSLCPRADGTIPESQQEALREMGDWLKINGEAIFATRRWDYPSDESDAETMKYIHTYSSKPNKRWHYDEMPEGSIRYTRSKDGNTVYVITLGIPAGNEIIAQHLGMQNRTVNQKIRNVELLGTSDNVIWKQASGGLVIQLPGKLPNDKALAYKVQLLN